MTDRTLNEMLNDVLLQSGFVEKNNFTLSADPDDKQMTSIANKVAIEIRDYFNWGELRKDFTLNLDTNQTRYQLPTDFRDYTPDSAWETDGSRRVEFPVPDGRWFLYKYTTFSDGGTIRCRKYGTELEVHDPVTGEGFSFEYITKWMVKDQNGALKERFTADSDTFLLDSQLLVLGIQAYWGETKMFPQAQAWKTNYMNKMNEAIARSAASRTIGGVGSDYDWLKSRSPYTPRYLP